MKFLDYRLLLSEIKKDFVFRWSFKICLAIWIIGLLSLLLVWSKLPPTVPFYYSLTWGEEQLAPVLSLLILLLALVPIYIFNLFAAVLVRPLSIFYSQLLLLSSCVIYLLTVFTTIRIALLVI